MRRIVTSFLMMTGFFSLGSCDYFEIKKQNEQLKAENKLQNDTNKGLNQQISEMKSERDSIAIPISSLKIKLTIKYFKQDENVQLTALPRISPVGQIFGNDFSLDMFDPGIAPLQIDLDNEDNSFITLTFIPKNPENLQSVDLKGVENLTTFRFRLRAMLERLGLSLSNESPPQAVLVINGIEISSVENTDSLTDEVNGWSSLSITNLTVNARNKYLGYLQGAM